MMKDQLGQARNLPQTKRDLLLEKLREKAIRANKTSGISRRSSQGPSPLSFAQESIWFLDQLKPGSPFYNIVTAARLIGPLDRKALERSLDEVVQRHESLRTSFVKQGGEPRQVIAEQVAVSLPVLDLGTYPADQRESIAHQQALALAQRPFDLANGPLWRAHVFQLDAQEHVLVLILHHIIADGWSMEVLVRELSVLYAAFLQGQASPLSALPIQYGDYAVWQRQWLQGETLAQQLAYWQGMLAGIPPILDLPTDHARPPVQSYRGAKERVTLPPQTYQQLKNLCQREAVTPFMVLLAAWGLLLGRWSGQEDLIIGTPIAGRKRTELESLIGLFVNTLALRVDLSAQPTFRELVQRVREVALGAYAHQELPFEKLVEALAPERDLSHQPLFNTVFIFQNTPISVSVSPDLSLQLLTIDNQTAKYDLVLSFIETTEGGLEGYLEYSTDLFEAATVENLLQHWQQLLQQVLIHPEQSIVAVDLGELLQITRTQERQITVHSYRLNLREIEEQLLQIAGVQSCAVAIHADEEKHDRMFAYLVAQPGHTLTSEYIHQMLRGHLPRYKMPDQIILLSALPRTETSEVDQAALQVLSASSRKRPTESIAPRTPLEELLVEIWREVLQVEEVGIHDNFFDLGGHSLLATQVIARLQEALESQIGASNAELEGVLISAMFEEPTIATLAYLLEQFLQQEHTLSVPPLQSVDRQSTLPLSFTQERLWFLDQLEPGNPFYNIVAAVRLVGPLDRKALERSLDEVVQRHESLRTSFVKQGGEPRQVIAEQVAVSLPVLDLGTYPADQRESIAHQQALALAQRPFDLANGPLWRAHVFQLDAQEHVLVLILHHIIADGWSMEVLVRELSVLYAAFLQGQASPLSALPIQYGDYAVWQRQWLQGETLAQQLAYWQGMLAGIPPILDLPTDHARPPVQSYRGAKERVTLPPQTYQQLKNLCQREAVTPFMVLLAAWGLLLGRWSGQEDLIIGTPIAGRKRTELESLIGLFVNTLALRVDLSAQPTFRELVQRVREVALGAYAHQELPFEKLVEALAPERDLSHQPLFQVMFILQNMPIFEPIMSQLTAHPISIENHTAKFDLTLELFEVQGKLFGWLEYNTDLFEPETIQHLVYRFQQVLLEALVNPDQPINAVSLLSIEEQQRVLVDWNTTQHPWPEPHNLVALFEAQVAQTPQAIAIIDGLEHLTYQQLDGQANQLARILQRQGMIPETPVGICLERSCRLVVAILAVLKAGGIYLPIDPGTPAKRMAFMLADAQAALLLSQSSLAERVVLTQLPTIWLDEDWYARLAPERSDSLKLSLEPEQAAYVVYTSGSTGLPKGVVGLHQGVVNRLHWMWQAYPFSANEVCCQKTSLSFVDAIAELFCPLLRGIPTVLLSTDESTDPLCLVDALARWRVSRLVLVPSLLSTLLETFPDIAVRLPYLQLWVTSGEALTTDLWQHFQRVLPGRRLLNLYGSSEVSADATAYEAPIYEGQQRVPIGRPLANTRAYLLDEDGQLVPIGVVGELYIGGLGLSRGYLNQPALTAECFVPDPFSKESGSRLYRTGDLAMYDADGMLEFMGRCDHRIKVRGFRIELGEIENVISRLSGVRASTVTTIKPQEGDIRLIAYIVAQPEQLFTSEQLRRVLREQLPSYMIPNHFVFLESMPLTLSGKVNQEALPELALELLDRSESYVAPRTPIEEILANIWAKVLQTKQVGIYDNFFDLGGHSLLATQVITQMHQAFGVDLPLRSLFEAATLGDLAMLIVQEQVKQVDSDALAKMIAEVSQLSTDEIQTLLLTERQFIGETNNNE